MKKSMRLLCCVSEWETEKRGLGNYSFHPSRWWLESKRLEYLVIDAVGRRLSLCAIGQTKRYVH